MFSPLEGEKRERRGEERGGGAEGKKRKKRDDTAGQPILISFSFLFSKMGECTINV